MVKSSDLLKIFLVLQVVEFCCTLPLGDDASYDLSSVSASTRQNVSKDKLTRIISQYPDQEIAGWIPVPASYLANAGYFPLSPFQSVHNHPAFNDRAYYAPPPKRNSELINSLLGLPKNMDSVGK